jgi:hypothetical protein
LLLRGTDQEGILTDEGRSFKSYRRPGGQKARSLLAIRLTPALLNFCKKS